MNESDCSHVFSFLIRTRKKKLFRRVLQKKNRSESLDHVPDLDIVRGHDLEVVGHDLVALDHGHILRSATDGDLDLVINIIVDEDLLKNVLSTHGGVAKDLDLQRKGRPR